MPLKRILRYQLLLLCFALPWLTIKSIGPYQTRRVWCLDGNVYVKWSHTYIRTVVIVYMLDSEKQHRPYSPTDKYMHTAAYRGYVKLREIHILSQNVRRNRWNVVFTENKTCLWPHIPQWSRFYLNIIHPALWQLRFIFSDLSQTKTILRLNMARPDRISRWDESSTQCVWVLNLSVPFFCCCLFVSHTTCFIPLLCIMPILLFRWAFGENLSYRERAKGRGMLQRTFVIIIIVVVVFVVVLVGCSALSSFTLNETMPSLASISILLVL